MPHPRPADWSGDAANAGELEYLMSMNLLKLLLNSLSVYLIMFRGNASGLTGLI